MALSHFDRIYASHFALVHGTALRITRDANDAQDVAQSVFLNIWAHRDSFEGGFISTTWLRVVSRNAAIDFLRRKARFQGAWIDLSLPEHVGSAESEVIREIDGASMWNALDRLVDRSRDLVQDSFICGRSHSNIAGRRGIALGTVKTRIRTGLTHLRLMLEAS